MEYLFSMQKLDLDIASEFTLMAATLLHIKSRLLLPRKAEQVEDQIDSKEELVLKLVEYKKYKEVANILKNRESDWSKYYYKLPEVIKLEVETEELDLSLYDLRMVYETLINKKEKRTNRRTTEISQIVRQEKFSVKNKIKEILRNLYIKPILKFSKLFSFRKRSKSEIITGFLAMLELARLKKVSLKQRNQFSDIIIMKSEDSSTILDTSYTYTTMEEL